MNKLKTIIQKELQKLTGENGKQLIVRTPETREEIDNLMNGSNALPIQQGIQYGYKIALENIILEIKNLES